MSKKDIVKSIQTTSPKSKAYFTIKNAVFVCSIIILTLLGVLAVASFLRDITILNLTYNVSGKMWPVILLHSVFELLILGLILGVLAVAIYRKTDWPLVRQQKILILSAIVLIIIGGGIGAYNKQVQNVLDKQNNSSILPLRKRRLVKIEQKLEDEKIIIGRVAQIDDSNQTITLQLPRGLQKELTYEEPISDIAKGDLVIVETDNNTMKSIKQHNPPRKLRQRWR